MAEPDEAESNATARGTKLPLIIGLVFAIAGAGGGFLAAYSGLLFPAEKHSTEVKNEVEAGEMPDVAFVPLEQIVVSLAGGATARHLQFRAQLEVPTRFQTDVETLAPRVIDVLNGYLRALEPADIESRSALVKIRAQMLRRVQMVAGQGKINDLLVMEFVLN